jgi:hypothetical protein
MSTLGAMVKGETPKLGPDEIRLRQQFNVLEARDRKPKPEDERQGGLFGRDEEAARRQANVERAGEISGEQLTEQFRKGPTEAYRPRSKTRRCSAAIARNPSSTRRARSTSTC